MALAKPAGPTGRVPRRIEESRVMDKDRIKGSFKQFSGNVKEGAGKLLGDKKTEAQGKSEKTEGEVQNAVGGVKDTIRAAVDKK
jgi:uncharacterized protein YjbJ (UPF0337 family)